MYTNQDDNMTAMHAKSKMNGADEKQNKVIVST